ncbi:ATP synthase F1 subunit delta [Puia dinghuensis]|uniref:ATP synthase subunit delta n=1 Tax=Puia dinghuensis TaxID=1792502 RepID=A0A8J2UF10_9BACT|nr:ATP synthase F1 subunit delta [Puia dinghuensis]GGB07150.1 ATP synthase subunit delta [Puia dinghuensis]
MMPNPRLAARYAKSILDLSIEKGELEEVYKDMLLLQDTFRSSHELVNLLRSPIIKADKKGKILDAIFAAKISSLTRAFITLLLNKEREGNLPEIAVAFVQQYKDYKGISVVKLTTAVPVSDDIKQALLQKLRTERQLQQIELDTDVRQELIGGFILEIGDQRIDTSVAFELNNIRKQFQNNDFIYKIR